MNNINACACSGCGGCVECCPAQCIHIEMTAEGFYKAVAEEDQCLNCGRCIKSCSMLVQQSMAEPIAAYAAYNCDEGLRRASSSGGIFTALSRVVLGSGGVVCGAAFDENMHLRHMLARTEQDLKALRGSKYLQSDTRGVYLAVKQALEEGELVLFSGTPCQVAGLRSTLGKNYEGLYTCDLVCHGAPSAGLFDGYRSFLERKYGSRIIRWDFRNKERANARMSYTVKLELENGDVRYISGDEEPYIMRFISGALQAESCSKCPYASINRIGDITLADYWGYELAHPELEKVQGVSLVLVNTEKGVHMLAQAKGVALTATEKDKYLKRNNHLSAPTEAHPQRADIYEAFAKEGFTKRFYRKSFLPDGYMLFILKRRIKGILR